MKQTYLALAASVLLSACATPQPTALTGDEIRLELVGQTFRYEGFERSSFLFSGSLDVRENGALDFRTDSTSTETGSWRLVDNSVCITLAVSRSGAENCVGVSRLGPDKYQTSDGYLLTRK